MADATYPALDVRFLASMQDLLSAALDDYEPLAIHEHETGGLWRVFFRTRELRDRARDALRSAFRNPPIVLSPVDVVDDDWARRSQRDLRAVRVGRIVVAPPWDVPAAPAPDTRLVVIEPSMGFGTGHHATTRLCLELLQTVDVAGRRATDVGTGSGVLAIAAAALGASPVVAIDIDPDALRNARDNVARNAVSVELREAGVETAGVPPAEIVLANLTAAVLQRASHALASLTARGGALIVSGFAPDELPAVCAAFGRRASAERREEDWAAALVHP